MTVIYKYGDNVRYFLSILTLDETSNQLLTYVLTIWRCRINVD